MKCQSRKCKSPACCLCTWGPHRNPNENQEYLCPQCLDQRWDELSRLVTEGLLAYHCTSLSEKEKGEPDRGSL